MHPPSFYYYFIPNRKRVTGVLLANSQTTVQTTNVTTQIRPNSASIPSLNRVMKYPATEMEDIHRVGDPVEIPEESVSQGEFSARDAEDRDDPEPGVESGDQ